MNPSGLAARAGLAVLAMIVAAAPARGDTRRWVTLPGKSAVAFAAFFPLGKFTGEAQAVAGEFRADADDLRQGITGVLRVKAAGLQTGDGGRDRDMHKALGVERYPEISFTVQQVSASFRSVTDKADVLLTITGIMLMRGVERPMTFPGRVRLREDKLWVRGEGQLKMTDFGVKPPTRFFLEVRETVLVSFDLLLAADP